MALFEKIYHSVFKLLEADLPPYLTYHSPDHTAYIVEQAKIISQHENADAKDIQLISYAALFHDVGFIQTYKGHEAVSCQIAKDFLKSYFNKTELDEIYRLIMATKIPHQPQSLGEKIMADADLEYLGTDLFFPWSELLFKELNFLDPSLNENEFRKLQIAFLKDHRYHTDYCKENREAQKQLHLEMLLNGIED